MSWNSTLELLQAIKQFSDSNNIIEAPSKKESEKSIKRSEETAYKVISVIDNDLEKLHKDLGITIEEINWQEHLFIEWWALFKKDWFNEGKSHHFVADRPESNWKWNTQIVKLTDKQKKWLLITSKQNYSCDRYQNIDKLKKELAWTESYFLFIEDYQWNKRIIQIGESIEPLEIALKYNQRWKTSVMFASKPEEINYIKSILNMFNWIDISDLMLVEKLFQNSNLDLISNKDDISKFIWELFQNKDVSQDIKNILISIIQKK